MKEPFGQGGLSTLYDLALQELSCSLVPQMRGLARMHIVWYFDICCVLSVGLTLVVAPGHTTRSKRTLQY